MKKMIDRIVKRNPRDGCLPVCAIGHSKEFHYDKDYRRILAYIARCYGDIVRMEGYSRALDRFGRSYDGVIQAGAYAK